MDHPPDDPSQLALREIGGWFRLMPTLVGSVEVLRTPQPKLEPLENYAHAHRRLQGVIEFAALAANRLGARLAGTGIFINPYGIEQRVRLIAESMLRSLVIAQLDRGEGRNLFPLPPSVMELAKELGGIGANLAALPPEKDLPAQSGEPAAESGVAKPQSHLPALGAQAQRFRDLLLDRGPHDCITSEALCALYEERFSEGIESSDLRKRIIPGLKLHGLETHGRLGYVFPEGCPARVERERERRR